MRFGRGSDVVRMWFGRGSDVVQMCFRCGSGVGRMWFGRVFGSGADSLAEAKGKWFPALGRRARAFWNRKRAFRNSRFQNTALLLLLVSIRQRFGLRAKNARAENPLVNNGMQQNAEAACVLGCVLKTLRFNNAFWLIEGVDPG